MMKVTTLIVIGPNCIILCALPNLRVPTKGKACIVGTTIALYPPYQVLETSIAGLASIGT